MIDVHDILETIKMIDEGYLDARTITMGTSLLDCCDNDIDKSYEKIYNKITRLAESLIKTGEDIEREYGILTINKRVSVTPIIILVAVGGSDPVKYAHTLERCAQVMGVNFIGGRSALIQKGYAVGDRELMESIPRTLAETERVCTSVNVGSTRADINMNTVELIGRMVKEAAELAKDRNCIGATKLVVLCNTSEGNPFMVGTFHGVGGADCVINVGIGGPGVIHAALAKADKSLLINEFADVIKKTAFEVTRMGQLVGALANERLGTPFGIVDLSLAPTPAIGDSVACTLEEMGLESYGAYGTTVYLTTLNDVVKKGGVIASSTVGGLSGTFIPAGEDAGMIAATRAGTLYLEKLEAMTVVCPVGLDMVVIPDGTTPKVTSGITADEAAIGIVSSRTTAARAIPAIGKKVGEELEFGGLLGSGPVMNINQADCSVMIHRKRRIPAPTQALKN